MTKKSDTERVHDKESIEDRGNGMFVIRGPETQKLFLDALEAAYYAEKKD